MFRKLATLVVFAAVIAASFTGSGDTSAAAAGSQPVSFNSWPKTVIYVYDTTAGIKKADGSPVWPVRAAAERWDDGNPVDFRYTTRGCPAKSQCVIVRQKELASPTVGVTSIGRIGTNIRSVTIVLDSTFGRTNTVAKRRNVTCHELGHALGLKHRTAKSSCLTSYVSTAAYPDRTDIKDLNRMYGHR